MIDRRTLMKTAVAASAAISVPSLGHASDVSGLVARAQAFLALLTPAQLAVATFAFDDPLRARWNYFGAGIKPGLRLEQMRRDKAEAALELLASVLSQQGTEKFDRVRLLQDVLRERGAGPSDRNADRYSFAIFGTPGPQTAWGLRVEGHHLSLSFTMVGDAVVSTTPSSFSSNPNAVRGGTHDGLVALRHEHATAVRLRNDLSAESTERATIATQPYRNILSTAGREARLFGARREGVALGDLHPAQRDLAMRIVDAYAVDHLVGPLADEQRARVREGDPETIRFAWAGGTEIGQQMYYRLHGATFVIELATNPPEPDHLHTIRHDPDRHLGRHVT